MTSTDSPPITAVRLTSVAVEPDDYVLSIERLDGSVISILVPREDRETVEAKLVRESAEPLGLNLVTGGHYY